MKDKYLRNCYRFCVSGFFAFGLMWTSSGCEKEHKVSQKEIIPSSSTTRDSTETDSKSTNSSTGMDSTSACFCTE
jgi:hypothetical protein